MIHKLQQQNLRHADPMPLQITYAANQLNLVIVPGFFVCIYLLGGGEGTKSKSQIIRAFTNSIGCNHTGMGLLKCQPRF